MKRSLYALSVILFTACNAETKNPQTSDTTSNTTIKFETAENNNNAVNAADGRLVIPPDSVFGDFDGDHVQDTGYLEQIKQEEYEPVVSAEDEEGDDLHDHLIVTYRLNFLGSKLPSIAVSPLVKVWVINEGDLDGDDKDDISLVKIDHEVLCIASIQTYSRRDTGWTVLLHRQLGRCGEWEHVESQGILEKKDGLLYFLPADEADPDTIRSLPEPSKMD